MAATDARPQPIKNTAYRVYFPILDADGDLVTGAAGLDSEVSKDAGAFADCTNEATEIATSSGMYYLDLTSTEMNADAVCVIVKTSTSGAKTTPIVLYPQEAGDIKVDIQTISGDATAADALEAILDGTGAKLYLDQLWIEAAGDDSAIVALGSGAGDGIVAIGGTSVISSSGRGMRLKGGADSAGLRVEAGDAQSVEIVIARAAEFLTEDDGMALVAENTSGGGAYFGTNVNGLYLYGVSANAGLELENDGSGPGFLDNGEGIASLVWDAVAAAHVIVDSMGEKMSSGGSGGSLESIDGSTTAAQNLRKAFDGTGFTATGFVVPTVTSVTNTVAANILQLLGSSTQAYDLLYLMQSLTSAQATGALTASSFNTNLTKSTNDAYNGLAIKFVTGNLAGQLSFVTDYNGSTKNLTVSPAFTAAPANNDRFILV